MKIITLGDEMLRQKAEKINNIDAELKTTIEKMLETLEIDKGLGLAGPQIGFMKRIFVTHIENDEPRIFINPSIIETSQDTVKAEEGCLSIPGIYADVIRSESVKVQAWNENGKPFNMEASGLLARVIQHEYDHLDGILFLDRLSESKREKLIEKYDKRQLKEHNLK
ncbi:MAG: peptide deformylase [Treponema sp.]|jgi:peptide deformylase|nr:peptide deformylase [Treponema sp.]